MRRPGSKSFGGSWMRDGESVGGWAMCIKYWDFKLLRNWACRGPAEVKISWKQRRSKGERRGRRELRRASL